MNKLLTNSILGITSQKDSESLQRAYLSALMVLYDLEEASICKLVISGNAVNVEQVIKFENTNQCQDSVEKCLDDIPKLISVDAGLKQCTKIKDIVVKELPQDAVNILIPVLSGGSVISIVSLRAKDSVLHSLDDIKFLSCVYENFYNLIRESECDMLTGLYNRRTFDAKLARMLSIQKSLKQTKLEDWQRTTEQRDFEIDATAYLVTLDIDFFKRVNDKFGHVAGDEVLLELSQKMKECFRYTDLLFRFGGEEFVIVLEPTPASMVWAALERFRKAIAEHNFPLVGSVTVSIGYAKIEENDYPVTILDYADKALYYSKEHGRNCINSYEQLVASGEIERPEVTGSIDLF